MADRRSHFNDEIVGARNAVEIGAGQNRDSRYEPLAGEYVPDPMRSEIESEISHSETKPRRKGLIGLVPQLGAQVGTPLLGYDVGGAYRKVSG